MFHKVAAVSPLDGYRLSVRFDTGESMRYDVSPLFSKWPVFQSLRDVPGLFERVQVDAGGYGISWNDDIDLSCDELWDNADPLDDILTEQDLADIQEAREEYRKGETVAWEDIDWD